jgi:putative DNA replication protein
LNFSSFPSFSDVDMAEKKKKGEIKYFKRLSSLPKKINNCSFEKAIVKSDKEKKIKVMLEKYCKNFEMALKNGIGLYFYGVRGTGKTFYSLCIYNELCKNYRVYRTSLMNIYKRIKKTWKMQDQDEEDVLNDLLKADLIILDDLGKEYLSQEWGKEKLFDIFNMLYEKEKCLIISTTLDPEQMSEYLSINGSDDVLDRLKENCKGLAFNWESRRKEVKKEIFEEIFG